MGGKQIVAESLKRWLNGRGVITLSIVEDIYQILKTGQRKTDCGLTGERNSLRPLDTFGEALKALDDSLIEFLEVALLGSNSIVNCLEYLGDQCRLRVSRRIVLPRTRIDYYDIA